MAIRWMMILAGLLGLRLWAAEVEQKVEDLASLQHRFLFVQQGWGRLGINTCAYADKAAVQPLQIGDEKFARGLGHHAPGEIVVELAGEYARFEATVGLQPLPASNGSVVFKVFVDDEERFDSGVMTVATGARQVSVSVAGAQELRLWVGDAGDGPSCDCANWAEARLTRAQEPVQPKPGEVLDAAPFAQVVTCDPKRDTGAKANRVQAYQADDVFLETAIAPDERGCYAVPTYEGGVGCIGLKWLERRRIRRFGFKFAEGSAASSTGGLQVQCWVGESAWQGQWKPLGGRWQQEGRTYTFAPDWSTLLEARSQTQKVRLLFAANEAGPCIIKAFSVPTPTPLMETKLLIEAREPASAMPVEIYNGEIVSADGQPVDGTRFTWDVAKGKSRLSLVVRSSKLRPWMSDRTVLRLGGEGGAGVAVEDVLARGAVDMVRPALFVTTDPAKESLEAYEKRIAGEETMLQEVRRLPDQTLERVFEHIHRPVQDHGPTMLSLACDNHKFIVHRSGMVQFGMAVPDDRTAVMKAPALPAQMVPTFGSGKNENIKRWLDGGWLPIPITEVQEGGIVYRQLSAVAPMGPADGAAIPRAMGVFEFSAANQGGATREAALRLGFLADVDKRDAAEIAPVHDGAVVFRRGKLLALIRYGAAMPMEPKLQREAGALVIAGKLDAGQVVEMTVYVPTWSVPVEEATRLETSGDLVDVARTYWQRQLAGAMQIELPDELLGNTIRASQVHCLIAARNEADGQRVAPWIASMIYGPLESEANSIIRGMAYFGHDDFCRRSLDFYIHRYSPEGFLTTGYTLMGTGWHLWMLGEYYQLTKDAAWLKRVGPEISRVCDWIVQQRGMTMRMGPDGKKVPEYGLMPPGVMADWNAFAYYFCLNGYYCAGLRDAGAALAEVGFPKGKEYVTAAADFADEIRRAYAWTSSRMPVYHLRNGKSVPGYSSQVHGPGPTAWFFPGEDGNRSWCYDVEIGAHHLVPFGILPAAASEVGMMMDHMEDVQFLSDGWFDYSAEENHKDPYNFGGFAKVQPYYCRNVEVYAMRDDVKPFIRSYFNTIPSLLSRENLSFQEHFRGVGAWNKTHETGYFLHQSRLMLVMERGEELWLAPFVTTNWLRDGMTVAATNAPTRFGRTSFRIVSAVAAGHIDATITPPVRAQPQVIVLRLRHPQGKPIREVIVNGQSHRDFDATAGTIRLGSLGGEVRVRANY